MEKPFVLPWRPGTKAGEIIKALIAAGNTPTEIMRAALISLGELVKDKSPEETAEIMMRLLWETRK